MRRNLVYSKAVVWLGWMLLALHPAQAPGQTTSAPRELGMAGAYTGMALGYEAVVVSPGNLGLAAGPAWSVGIPQLAVGGSIVGPGMGDLLDLIRYDEQTDDRRTELLSRIPNGGTEAGVSVRLPVLALSVGGVGFAATYSGSGRHSFSRDVVELFVEGYEEGRTEYSVGNSAGGTASYWDYALGYGRSVGGVSVGMTGHYQRGATIGQSRLLEPRIFVDVGEVEVEYVGVHARDGSGFSLDIGASFQPTPELVVSGSIANVIGRMDWSEEPHVRSLTIDRGTIEEAGAMDLRDLYVQSDRPMSAAPVTDEIAAIAEGLLKDADLPAIARVGVVWRVRPGTRVAADVHRRFATGRMIESWEQRLAIGFEQTFSAFGVRAGYARGDGEATMVGAGFSVGPLSLGMARFDRNTVAGAPREDWIATAGLGIMK